MFWKCLLKQCRDLVNTRLCITQCVPKENCDRLFQSMMWGIGEQFRQTGFITVIGVLIWGTNKFGWFFNVSSPLYLMNVYEDFWDHF